jgi:hypothetical protein
MPGTAVRNNIYRRGDELPNNASLLIATVLRHNVLSYRLRGAGLGQAMVANTLSCLRGCRA